MIVRLTEDHPTFNQLRLNGFALETQVVPEPASAALLLFGLTGGAAMPIAPETAFFGFFWACHMLYLVEEHFHRGRWR